MIAVYREHNLQAWDGRPVAVTRPKTLERAAISLQIWNRMRGIVRQWDAMIDGDVLEGARRHTRTYRLARILDDGCTAMPFDFAEPGGAVVEAPGQYDADHARSMALGCAGKQGVDRRPAPVHARAARERHVASSNDKMMVGRGDVNFAGADQLALRDNYLPRLLVPRR